MECNSIPFISFINFIHHCFLKCSFICSNPLFSTIVALYTLILLYAPSFFLRILLNPILNTTGITLICLLRLGANERSRKESVLESKTIDSSAYNRLENESSYLGSIDLDHKDIHDEWLSIDGDNLCTYSSLVIESTSLEPTFLDFIDQTHVDECDGIKDLGGESNQNNAKLESNSSLDIESNQMHVELEHDLGSESKFLAKYQKWDYLDTNFMESSQVVIEERKQMDSKQVDTKMKFLEWSIKAPLEIIYEAYEGEEEQQQEEEIGENNEPKFISSDKQAAGCERYPSLSMYYPESETDSSSDDDFQMNEDWDSQDRVFVKWEEELDDREELIEISLDGYYGQTSSEFSHADEDNMIEIDIFPTASSMGS
uniref:uncharacterized protein LOC122595763 n=1 Tax=Erigeron canadensis TaxID=72917 RepID=UPI001CB951D0|nr:uncharacterized protein LOC122595763 [Erigeron canadensis]